MLIEFMFGPCGLRGHTPNSFMDPNSEWLDFTYCDTDNVCNRTGTDGHLKD